MQDHFTEHRGARMSSYIMLGPTLPGTGSRCNAVLLGRVRKGEEGEAEGEAEFEGKTGSRKGL